MMNSDYEVLLINFSNWITPSRIPKVLVEAGCRLTLLAPQENLIAISRYIHHPIAAPNNMSDFLEAMKSHVESTSGKYVWVIPMDDNVLYMLSDKRKEPWVAACCPVDPHGQALDFLLNKAAFPLIAEQMGLPVPKSRLCQNYEEACDFAHLLGYPIIHKKIFGAAGFGIHRIENDQQLVHVFQSEKASPNSVIQEYLPGRIGGAAALYDHGKLVCWMSAENIKTHPAPYGPSSAFRLYKPPRLEGMLLKLGEITGFHGFSGVDFIEDAVSGEIKLLEQHARPTAHVSIGKRVGVDFAQAIRLMLENKKPALIQSCSPQQRTYIPLFPQDISRSLQEKDYRNCLKWLFSIPWWRDIDWTETALLGRHFQLLSRQAFPFLKKPMPKKSK